MDQGNVLTSPVKRQKIDQDGFVTPATPDLPRFNHFEEISTHLPVDSEIDVSFEAYHVNNNETEEQGHNYICEKEAEQCDFSAGGDAPIRLKNNETDSAASRECTLSNNAHELDQDIDIQEDVKAILSGMGEESKKVHSLWSDSFSNSKNFELFLPGRLDKILHEALEYEQHLIKQKEQLKQRLGVLSKTLQKD